MELIPAAETWLAGMYLHGINVNDGALNSSLGLP